LDWVLFRAQRAVEDDQAVLHDGEAIGAFVQQAGALAHFVAEALAVNKQVGDPGIDELALDNLGLPAG